MLGDFSQQAANSRFSETGAPGHPTYAVPQSYLIGVVTAYLLAAQPLADSRQSTQSIDEAVQIGTAR